MRARGFDVVVPSYRRPLALGECLAGLAVQDEPPVKVLVVARPEDTATWAAAQAGSGALPVDLVPVHEPGLVAALRAGVAATRSPRVAFTDDDAVPHPGWLSGLAALLDEPGVGVAGGRDLVPGELEPGRHDVGTLAPWGRFSGDHHLGRGSARDVHVVKGVNMAFRAEALALPRAGVLHGAGTEIHSEELMCAWARARGWRVRYDPAITVDHRLRPDESVAPGADAGAGPDVWRARAHNRMLGTLATDPDRSGVHVAYAFGVGTREAPGVVRALVAAVRGERDVTRRTRASVAGGWTAVRNRGCLEGAMLPCSALRGAED